MAPVLDAEEVHTDEYPSHAFSLPGPSGVRCPCPALNTLSNHGYLPRDGHNITAENLLSALQDPRTYRLSPHLARILVQGGFGMMLKEPPLSLYDFSRHGRIEHNGSITHKDTETGKKFAPTRCDTVLLDALLEGKEFLTLGDVAKQRVMLEKVTELDSVHREIARGEWALVLGIFGRENGGSVPTAFLREWLKENRFPEGWKPTHEQGLLDTFQRSWAIHGKMHEFKEDPESPAEIAEQTLLGKALRAAPEEEGGRRLELATQSPRPAKRQKTIP